MDPMINRRPEVRPETEARAAHTLDDLLGMAIQALAETIGGFEPAKALAEHRATLAAAPELLAACRAALAEKSRAYQDTFDSRMDNDPTVRTLRAAIAKAEGRP